MMSGLSNTLGNACDISLKSPKADSTGLLAANNEATWRPVESDSKVHLTKHVHFNYHHNDNTAYFKHKVLLHCVTGL